MSFFENKKTVATFRAYLHHRVEC